MPPARATILDIARELGLSKSTVANVLSGTGRFSAETSALVHEAADRLGYVSNRAARSLRSRRVGAFGLYVPPIARTLAFYMEFAFGAARGAGLADADLTLFARGAEDAGAATRAFQVDGALMIDPEPGDPLVEALLATGLPVVSIGRYTGPGAQRVAATIEARHDALQREVLDRLHERGMRRPALLAVDEAVPSAWAVGTLATFTAWCVEHGIEPVVCEVGRGDTWARLVAAVDDALDVHRADALICAAQDLAAQSRHLLEGRGETDGIQLASFAGARPTETDDPLITAVDLAPARYGEAAAALLAEVLDGATTSHRWFDGAAVRFAD